MTHPEPTIPSRIPNKIRNRLVMAVSLLVVATTVLTVGGFGMLSGRITAINAEVRRTNQLVDAEATLHLGLARQQAMVITYALLPTAATPAGYRDAVEAEVEAFIEIGRLAFDDGAIVTASLTARQAATNWRARWAEPFMREARENEFFAPRTLVESSDREFQAVLAAVEAVDELTEQRHESAAASLAALTRQQGPLVAAIVAGLALLIALGGWWLVRSISGPLHRLNGTAQALIAGQNVTFVQENDDEIGGLAVVLEQMRADAASRFVSAKTEAEMAVVFNQLAELTAFAHDEPTLVDAAIRGLRRVSPSARGQVMLLNNSTNRLTVAAAWGADPPEIGSIVAVERTDRCPGIRRANVYIAEDVSDEMPVKCAAHPAEHGSVVCLPMPALGSIVGVIHLERSEPNSFATVDVQRASRIAEQVALAVANARLLTTMEGLANTDPLTGLRNARFFDAYLEQQYTLAQRDGDSIGLLMLDVDLFKQFNDTYGHPAGDEALRALARTIRGVLRTSDVVARYGGEEFIIALHHLSLPEAAAVAEKIRAAVQQTIIEIGPGRYGRITVSIGVAATDAHQVERKASSPLPIRPSIGPRPPGATGSSPRRPRSPRSMRRASIKRLCRGGSRPLPCSSRSSESPRGALRR